MSFLKTFMGAMATAEISEKRRVAQEKARAQKEQEDNEEKCYRLRMQFYDYMESINCVNASFADYEAKRVFSEDPCEEARIIKELKAKLKEYMSLGGNPVYIYDFEKMNLYIEIVKRLKEYGWLEKQEEYVKSANEALSLAVLDFDWQRAQKNRRVDDVQIPAIINAKGNELSEVIKSSDYRFIPYEGHHDAIVIDIAKSKDGEMRNFLEFLTISIIFSDEYILIYNHDRDEMYYKADVKGKKVDIFTIPGFGYVSKDWSLVELNGMSLLFKTEKANEVEDMYSLHNDKVDEYIQEQYATASEDINSLTGVEFEELCRRLMENMGFSVETTKASGDGGIDLIAYNSQPLLSGKYIIQCKRYIGSVGEPVIRDLYGVVTSERANKGILMTSGVFTKQAQIFADGKPIELIDGVKLRELLQDYYY